MASDPDAVMPQAAPHDAEPSLADLAEVVRRLDDDRQIRNLLARIAHLADYGDLEEYVQYFTDDARWHSAAGVVNVGREAILSDRERRRAERTQGPGAGKRHFSTTLCIEVDGSDVARAHSYYLFTEDEGDRHVVKHAGRYEDTLHRTAEGWKLASRRIRFSE